ncbi:MAG: hypothetical protein FWH21_04305, partial [Kiritimatiellaeota bacterium]|nr:hypothetical protein [Kiritimatiellota bacterium]
RGGVGGVEWGATGREGGGGRGWGGGVGARGGRGGGGGGGFFVAEMTSACPAAEVPGWSLLRDRTYGHTRVALYRLGGEE